MRPSPVDTTPTTTPIPATTTTKPTKPRPITNPTSSSTSSSSSKNDPPPSFTTQPQLPSHVHSHSNNRTSALAANLRSLPYKKIALYLRLLILVLAFVTLILDAITLSFEVNVMNLDMDEVAAQAAFLFSPDVLAMVLFLVLLIYPMRYCFSRQYDTPHEDMPLDEEQDLQANVSETSLGPDTRSRSSSRQKRRSNRGNGSSGSSGSNRSSRSNRSSSDISQDRYHEPKSSRKQGKQRAIESHGEREQQGLGLDPEMSPRHPYDDYHREPIRTVPTITITMAQTPSPSPPPPPQQPTFPPISSPSSRSSSPSLEKPSLSPIQGSEQQYTQDDQEKKKNRWFYTFVGLRIFFALVLVALALYWPASGRKPPMGYNPRGDRSKHHRERSWHDGRGGTPSLSLAIPSTTTLSSPAVSPTIPASTNSISGYNSDSDLEFKSLMAARINKNHGQGNNNNNRNASEHWCSVEESYGDNQSAFVYCQVKHIRPVMVYFWVGLVIVELGMAYMAGELSRKPDPEVTPNEHPDPEKHDYDSSRQDDLGEGAGRLDVSIRRAVIRT
ncbi:hypothetical protein BGZ92_010459 [Podila epicladia]|nr:hypothetical protein BGZ92_010459 [Podila epicladia]